MAKAKRKMKKSMEKNKKMQNKEIIQKEKVVLMELSEKHDYAEVINKLAEIISKGIVDADICYEGAYAYFMLADYNRAVQWVENALQYDALHSKSRILLARICILEDREDDALKVIEFSLNYCQINDKEREELLGMLGFYGDYYPDKIKENYHHIAELLGIAEEIAENDNKEYVMEVEDEILYVERLEIVNDDKVKMLNSLAGASFYKKEYDKAKKFLDAALKIDNKDDNTLTNISILLNEMGCKDEALSAAGKIQKTNFWLLSQLR